MLYSPFHRPVEFRVRPLPLTDVLLTLFYNEAGELSLHKLTEETCTPIFETQTLLYKISFFSEQPDAVEEKVGQVSKG